MLALEAGAEYDKRCGDQKALSAFLTVAKPGDEAEKPYLNLIVNQTGEGINPIKTLRAKLEAWKSGAEVK